MALAIFDLDNTLLNGDSDYLWGVFLAEQGLVDGALYERENQRFYEDYKAGRLDIFEFLRFSLRPLAEHPLPELLTLRELFMREKIEPIILPAARDLIARHREAGDTLLIITATNSFVTQPIAERLGIPHLIATEPERINGRYTGKVAGIPSFQDGKVKRLQEWLVSQEQDLADSCFYSDSHNDIALMEAVERAVAVDPDPQLSTHAKDRGWSIISLRG